MNSLASTIQRKDDRCISLGAKLGCGELACPTVIILSHIINNCLLYIVFYRLGFLSCVTQIEVGFIITLTTLILVCY